MLIRRDDLVVTTGITTAVVLVVAALGPHDAWQQPILRLVDTVIGVAVGIVAATLGLRASSSRARSTQSRRTNSTARSCQSILAANPTRTRTRTSEHRPTDHRGPLQGQADRRRLITGALAYLSGQHF
jgi:uncharacterized membrane protein YccC